MAAKLCTPILDSLLSNLSKKVFVANCIPAATIVVRSLTRPDQTLVKAPIGAPDGFLDLLSSAALIAGDRLVVSQSDAAGTSSGETAAELAVVVGQAPTKVQEITPVDISGRLRQCGRHAFVAGAIPGARVEIRHFNTTIGQGVADGGIARITLTSAFQVGTSVEVRQTIGGLSGAALQRDVEPLASGEFLPAPLIPGPIRACQTAVRIEGVFEGAEVTLTRKSGEVETAPFDLSGLWFNLSKPLAVENGWVKARQDMPACRRQGQEATADVQQAVPPGPPYVFPLCAGMVSVFIENLQRGAEVRIKVGADVYTSIASAEGYNRFDVEPLPAGTISVQTFLCGLGSEEVIAPVDQAPAEIDAPVIVGTLIACQRTVSVGRLKPGAIVQVWAKGPSIAERPISGQLVAWAEAMDIDVTTLIEGAEVWVVQWACQLTRRESDHLPVRAAPAILDPVFTEKVTRIDKSVTVKGTLRDARVDVLRQAEVPELIGSATAKSDVTTVPINVTLAVGQVLRVRQRYCAVQTPARASTTVVVPRPLQPVILSPTSGQSVAVARDVALAWKDPAAGADADRKADTFDVQVVRGGTVVLTLSQAGTTATLPASAVVFGAQFQWTIVPRNATGAGPQAQSSFKTPAAPPPVIAAVQDKDKIKVTGTGFAASHAVEIDIATEYSALVGSPQAPVEFNDNRTGKTSAVSTATGTIDTSFSAAAVLEPQTVLTGVGGGSQMVKAPPYPGAKVTVVARNKPPISASEGSAANSNKVVLTWTA